MRAGAPGRAPAVLIGLGALALAVVTGGWRDAAAAYRAAWLVLLALPVGALPVAIALERFGRRAQDRGEGELAAALRRLVALMPAAAILGIPVLLSLTLLHPRSATEAPLSAIWFAQPFFAARVAACLAAWMWLAARFATPTGAACEGRTVAGVALHAVVGTIVVTDLVASLDHRLGSSLEGLLVLTAWSGLAFAAAILTAPEEPAPVGRGRVTPGRDRLVPLVVLLALWAFLHFIQFLVVWSANLPDEVSWYLARGGGLGRALALAGGGLVLLGGLATLRPGRATTRVLAAAILAVHGTEMFWFVTPALRDRFVVTGGDLLALAGVAALAVAALPRAARPVPARRGGAAA